MSIPNFLIKYQLNKKKIINRLRYKSNYTQILIYMSLNLINPNSFDKLISEKINSDFVLNHKIAQ